MGVRGTDAVSRHIYHIGRQATELLCVRRARSRGKSQSIVGVNRAAVGKTTALQISSSAVDEKYRSDSKMIDKTIAPFFVESQSSRTRRATTGMKSVRLHLLLLYFVRTVAPSGARYDYNP